MSLRVLGCTIVRPIYALSDLSPTAAMSSSTSTVSHAQKQDTFVKRCDGSSTGTCLATNVLIASST
jgi:hypothetical protein